MEQLLQLVEIETIIVIRQVQAMNITLVQVVEVVTVQVLEQALIQVVIRVHHLNRHRLGEITATRLQLIRHPLTVPHHGVVALRAEGRLMVVVRQAEAVAEAVAEVQDKD
jgi:hypothetical protein